MTEPTVDPALVLLLVGALTAAALWLKSGLEHLGLPALIGFLLLGLTVRCANAGLGLFGAGDLAIIKFLGQAGLVTLLFRVGLESNLRGLLKQLRSASLIWTADVALSGLLGYASAFYLLNLGLTSSLVVATAFTATSVGISVAVWQEMEAINSPAGELLIDIAELDDISAILLMALLFAVLPQLSAQGLSAATVPLIAGQVALFLLKFAGFGLLCFLFSLYVEKPISRYFRELESAPDPMLSIAALAFVIAALAERLGFSTAIGAFFAGLIFSRDPETVKMESSFMPIYDFFSPFFFITIGLQLDPAALMAALGPGLLLAAAAIGAKLLAVGLPLWGLRGRATGLLVGASMVPRAEIAMVILQRGQALEGGPVTPRLYNAMVLVCAVTCIGAPFAVRRLLQRYPLQGQGPEARGADPQRVG